MVRDPEDCASIAELIARETPALCAAARG